MSSPFAFQAPTSPTTPRSPLPAAALDCPRWVETLFTPTNRQICKSSGLCTQSKKPEIYYKWSGTFPHCKVRGNRDATRRTCTANSSSKQLYRYQSSALERLPSELTLMILGQSADISSLYALIRASPLYYQAFLSDRDKVLTSAILRELKSRSYFRWFKRSATLRLAETPHRFRYCFKPFLNITPKYEFDGSTAFKKLYDHLRSGVPMTLNVQQVMILRKDWRMTENDFGRITIRIYEPCGLSKIADLIEVR